MPLGDRTLEKLISQYDFATVLDLGCGGGKHSEILRAAGKKVTAIDLSPAGNEAIKADYLQYEFGEQFDCVWCCHVLEHQLNVHMFLRKILRDLKNGGILAITVPPLKHQIVSGHMTLWNAGLLLYNLVCAGFDCSAVAIKTYGYNVSIITAKGHREVVHGGLPEIFKYFPKDRSWHHGFDGRISSLNW